MDNWLYENIFVLILASLSIFELLSRGTRAFVEKRVTAPTGRTINREFRREGPRF